MIQLKAKSWIPEWAWENGKGKRGKNNYQLPSAHSIQSASDCWVGKKSQKEKELLSVTMILGIVNHSDFHWCLFFSVLGGILEAERQESSKRCHATWLVTFQLTQSCNHRNGKITKEIKSVSVALSPHGSLLSPLFCFYSCLPFISRKVLDNKGLQ